MPLQSFGQPINVAIVGASGALGSAFVRQLADDPSVKGILALSRSPQEFELPGIDTAIIDLADPDSISSAVENASSRAPFDLLIIASGILHTESVQPEKAANQLQYAAMSSVFAANTTGPAILMAGFLPLMRRDRKSVIAAISARVGSIADNRLGGWVSYRASKAALNMVIKTFSIEQARKNRHCAIVALQPGTVDTALSAPFNARVAADKLFSPDAAAEHLLAVIDDLEPADTGGFFAWDGSPVPY